MRANNKLKEVILGTLFYLLRFYPKKVKQCNTMKSSYYEELDAMKTFI